ncbi:MAG: WG repeat-containing protein, partial [Bacteroidota bacterium]
MLVSFPKMQRINKISSFILLLLISGYYCLSQELIPYRQKDLWGYMSTDNRIVITPKFEETRPFQYNRGIVMKNKKLGYIDTTGKIIIPCKYDTAYDFFERHRDTLVASVKMGGKWRNIDLFGNEKPYQYPPGRCGGDFGIVIEYGTYKINNLFGIVRWKEEYDSKNAKILFKSDTIMKPQYIELKHVDNSQIFIANNNKYGLISPQDSIIKSFEYDTIYFNFIENIIYLKKGENIG